MIIEVMIHVVMTARTTSGRSGAIMIVMIVVLIVVIGHDTATVENVGHHVQLERESRCS